MAVKVLNGNLFLRLGLFYFAIVTFQFFRGDRSHAAERIFRASKSLGLTLLMLAAFGLFIQTLDHFKLIDLKKMSKEKEDWNLKKQKILYTPKSIAAVTLAFLFIVSPMLITLFVFSHPLAENRTIWALDYAMVEKYKFILGAILTFGVIGNIFISLKWTKTRSAKISSQLGAAFSFFLFWIYLIWAKEQNLVMVAWDLSTMMMLFQFPALYLNRMIHEVDEIKKAESESAI